MRMRLLGILFLLFLNTVHAAYAEDKLIFAIDLIRHGDRTSLGSLPKAPHTWEQGKGQLTAEGMHQHFQLGKLLRKNYIEQNHLLPEHYIMSTMFVRSTDYDRTLMSAQSLLMGLYPLGTGPQISTSSSPEEALPQAYQPIPIHTIPREMDAEFLSIPDIHLSYLLQQYVFSRPDWVEKTNALKDKFPRWERATGVHVQNLVQLSKLADTLYVYKIHHVALPEDLSTTDREEIIDSGRWAFATMFKPQEVGRAMGHPLLVKIIKLLQHATQENTLKYVLLSGHDGNILAILSALQAPLSAPPPYASDLNFSLFEVGTANYEIRITFNQQPVYIPACHGNRCSLAEIMSLIDDK